MSYPIDSGTLSNFLDHLEWCLTMDDVNSPDEDRAWNIAVRVQLHFMRQQIEKGEWDQWSTPSTPTQ